MVAPDNELIAKVLLASEGFVEGHTLAVRLVSLFVAAADGLSSQQHYDWGLRALKACLGTAGRLLRQVRLACTISINKHQQPQQLRSQLASSHLPTLLQRNASSECGGRPGEGLCAASSSTTAATSASSKVVSESNILVQAVCDTKLPTLTPEDDARFRLLLSAAFPGALTSLAPSESSLKTGLHAAAAEFGISLSTLQMERALQLHLAMEQRIGVILVGPPGSGKSTLYQARGAIVGRG
jgi:dynein heavy chain 2, cytosolic